MGNNYDDFLKEVEEDDENRVKEHVGLLTFLAPFTIFPACLSVSILHLMTIVLVLLVLSFFIIKITANYSESMAWLYKHKAITLTYETCFICVICLFVNVEFSVPSRAEEAVVKSVYTTIETSRGGKYVRYHFPLRFLNCDEEMEATKDYSKRYDIGDTVLVKYRTGFFGNEYFYCIVKKGE